MGFTYNFFSVTNNCRRIAGAKRLHVITLDSPIVSGDLISGKLFYSYDHEDTSYFFEVVFLSQEQDVYIRRSKRIASRRIKRRKKIFVRGQYINTAGIVLRKIPQSKFRKETITRPSNRYYLCQNA